MPGNKGFRMAPHLVLRTQSLVRALSAKYADDCKKTSPGAENCTGPAQEKPCFASTSPVSKCHVPSFVLHSVSCCFYVLPLFAWHFLFQPVSISNSIAEIVAMVWYKISNPALTLSASLGCTDDVLERRILEGGANMWRNVAVIVLVQFLQDFFEQHFNLPKATRTDNRNPEIRSVSFEKAVGGHLRGRKREECAGVVTLVRFCKSTPHVPQNLQCV